MDLSTYRKGGRLVLSKNDIEYIASSVLRDFKPQALKEPMALSADEFIEQYLGFKIRYEHITNNQSILGMVTFSGGRMIVYDAETDGIREIFVDEKTVLIDSTLLNEDKRGRYEFTGFHEGGHCVLHAPEKVHPDQIGMFSSDRAETIICRTSDALARGGTPQKKTDGDWIEWQADYFSACMKMPRIRVREVAIESLRSIGINRDSISAYDKDTYEECDEYLPCLISETFVTSKAAARYRLQELKILKQHSDFLDLYDI